MATLQWRPVDAPNFGSAFQGLNTATGMINTGLGGLDNLLAGVQAGRDRRADSTVIQNMLAQGDADQFRAALADGSIYGGADRNRLSDSVLTALSNRTGTLQNQRASDQSFNTNQYNQNRTQQQNAAEDAAAPIYSRMLAAEARGDSAGARRIAEENAGVLSALSFNRQGDVSQNRQGTASRFIGNEQASFNLGQAREGAADTRAANAALNQAVLNSVDPQSALQEYTRVSRELGANAAAQFRSGLESRFPGLFGAQPVSGAVASGGTGTPGTRQGSIYDVTYQHKPTDTPITQMNMGQIQTMQDGMKKTQGHSPLGAYQINQATLEDYAPKVLGKNWRDLPFSPENQDKIAEALFNARKSGNLKATWAALPNATPGAYKDMTWDQVKGEIAGRETGISPQQLRDGVPSGSAVAQQLIESTQRRFTQDNIGDSSQALTALEGDNQSGSAIADQMIGEGGVMAGRSKGAALNLINTLGREYGLNPAQAARLIEDNQSPRSIADRAGGAILNAASFGMLGRPLSQSSDVDINQLRARAEEIQSGGGLQRLAANAGLVNNMQDIQARQVAQQNAAGALQLAQQRLAIDPNNPTLQRLVAERTQAFARAQAGAGAQNVQSAVTPDVNALLRSSVQRRGLTADDVILIEPPSAPVRGQDTIPLPAGRGRGINW